MNNSDSYINILKKFKLDLIILTALALLYINYIPNWVKHWTSFDSFYSFFPFLLIFGYYFFKNKFEELKNTEIKPSNWGLMVLSVGVVFYYVTVRAEIDQFNIFSLFFMISGVILFIYGKKIFLKVLPVIILFSISIPVIPLMRLSVPLQIMLAGLVTKILNLLNVDAYNLGSNIYIDKYLLTVEAGCTGVKSLSSLLVISFLLIYFKHSAILKKFLFILFAGIISFIGNMLRILITDFYIIYNGLNSEAAQKSAEDFHYLVGFIIFFISLVIILFLSDFIEENKIVSDQ
jgi:exosortase